MSTIHEIVWSGTTTTVNPQTNQITIWITGTKK